MCSFLNSATAALARWWPGCLYQHNESLPRGSLQIARDGLRNVTSFLQGYGRNARQRIAGTCLSKSRDRQSQKHLGWLGILRSAFTMTRPARSIGAPSFLPSEDAATPAAHRITAAGIRSPPTQTAPGSILVTIAGCAHFNPKFLQLPHRTLRKIRSVRRQDARAAFKQQNPSALGINRAEFMLQDFMRDFRQSACEFHPSRTSANDRKVEHRLWSAGYRLLLRKFKGQ